MYPLTKTEMMAIDDKILSAAAAAALSAALSAADSGSVLSGYGFSFYGQNADRRSDQGALPKYGHCF